MPPVNAQVITLLLQDGLLLGAQLQPQNAQLIRAPPDHLLSRLVHRPLARDVRVQLHHVRPAVHGAHPKGQIGDRAGEDFQIIGQQRRAKLHRQRHTAVLKLKNAPGGRHGEARLPHGGDAVRLHPGKAHRLPVHPDQAAQRLHLAGPVAAPRVRKPVGGAPHAEIGVMRHQRNRRRPEGRGSVPHRLGHSAKHARHNEKHGAFPHQAISRGRPRAARPNTSVSGFIVGKPRRPGQAPAREKAVAAQRRGAGLKLRGR